MSRYRLGIDIGGTFTDLNVLDEQTGKLNILKTPSVPGHPSQAVVNGIRELVTAYEIDPSAIYYVVHGTTLALNTLLQRNGATCGLLVTKGFRDILELQRLRLPNPHEFYTDKPKALIRRKHVREISERLLFNGKVLTPLDPEEVVSAARGLMAEGVEAITVCFLHAYKNDVHEQQAKLALHKAFPELYVSTSSEVWPQQREYERGLITVINAYVGSAMAGYFYSLEGEVNAEGLDCTVLSTKSNGGIMSVRSARELPVQTLLSGPASGVMGALYVGKLANFGKLITFDLGGTSADIAVVNGQLPFSTESKVGDFPMIMPVVDIASIGAGGGSVAWVDQTGVLKVGPMSAGADPGPAAYGRGGEQATITDAYIEVGILDPTNFLGGQMPLDAGRARAAISKIGENLKLSSRETAEAILRVATSNMYAELVPLMARQGVDASEFALLPYGGAGPTHAFLLAQEVGIQKVIVPPDPGTLCALGCLVADIRGDFIRTVFADFASLESEQVEMLYAELEEEAERWLDAQNINVERHLLERQADMRYHGQSFETAVELGDSSANLVDRLVDSFHDQYQRSYGYADRKAAVELINLRISITGVTPKPELRRLSLSREPVQPVGFRQVHLGSEPVKAAVYKRSELRSGHTFAGPAIVEQYDSTSYVPAGFRIGVDDYGNLIGVAT